MKERTNETFSEYSTKGKNGIHSFRMTAINTDKTNVHNNQHKTYETNERKEQTKRETNNSKKERSTAHHQHSIAESENERWFIIMMLSHDKNKQASKRAKIRMEIPYIKSILSDKRGFVCCCCCLWWWWCCVYAIFAQTFLSCSAYLVQIARVACTLRSLENCRHKCQRYRKRTLLSA